jgi:hypothetical protein
VSSRVISLIEGATAPQDKVAMIRDAFKAMRKKRKRLWKTKKAAHFGAASDFCAGVPVQKV